MRLDQLSKLAFDHLLGRMFRRALIAMAIAACAIVAVDHFTAAGFLALEAQYGAMHARLAIGAIYGVLGLAGITILWATRNRPAASPPALARQRETQLIMLVEAVMLGYTLARKANPNRAS
jgi:hypothetical protein